MVYAGTLTRTDIEGIEGIDLSFSALDADGEETHALEPVDLDALFHMTDATMYLTTTNAGPVIDVVDVKLQGSVYGTQWQDLIAITDADVDNGGGTAEDSEEKSATVGALAPFRYLRVLVTTVGAANVITSKVRLYKVAS